MQREIQELCGHSSIATTFNVYGHLLLNLSERLADRLAEVFLEAAAHGRRGTELTTIGQTSTFPPAEQAALG